MKNGNLVFSNARVKSLESSLITEEKMTRMIHAANLEEGVKILYECGYAGGTTLERAEDYPALLEEELKRVTAFFRETMISSSGMDAFLLEEDYLSAKIFMKKKYMRDASDSGDLPPEGNISHDTLKECIFNDNYSSFPKFMAEALHLIDELFASGRRSPRYIDTCLDKAMYKDIHARISKGKNKTIIEYFKAKTDLTNIATALRVKKIGNASLLKDNYIEGGSYSLGFLESLIEESNDSIAERLKYSDYRDIAEASFGDYAKSGSLVRFEAMSESYLMKIFRRDKGDIFSVAPIIGFFVAKRTEIRTVRLILTALKNNVGRDAVKERLREFYV